MVKPILALSSSDKKAMQRLDNAKKPSGHGGVSKTTQSNQKNYKGKWKICSINRQRHGQLPLPEMVAHIKRCPDRGVTNDGDGATNDKDSYGSFPRIISTNRLSTTIEQPGIHYNTLPTYLMATSEPTDEDLVANELDDKSADTFRSISPLMNKSEPNEEIVANLQPTDVLEGFAYGILKDDEVSLS